MFLNKMYRHKNNNFGPRTRFNWGYHDACHETEMGRARALHPTVHSTLSVSPTFDVMYFEGYKAGLAETDYAGNSQAAWETYRATLSDSQLREIYRAEILAGMVGCSKGYEKYRMPDVARNATAICGRAF